VELVRRECGALGFSPRQIRLNIPVALSEAIANAIRAGNQGDASKRVRVRAQLDATQLVVDVHDEGTGFDLDSCTLDPAHAPNQEREDGRGLFLMRQLMDRVECVPGPGNTVRLTLARR